MIDRLDQSNESLHIPEVLLWLVNIYVKIIDIGLWSNQETDTDAQSCELNSHPDFFCCFFFNKNATSEFSNQILFWVGVFSDVIWVRKLTVRACVCRLWRCSKSDWLISNRNWISFPNCVSYEITFMWRHRYCFLIKSRNRYRYT